MGAYVFYNLCPVCGRLYAEGSAHYTLYGSGHCCGALSFWSMEKLFSPHHILAAIMAGAMLLVVFLFYNLYRKPAIPLTLWLIQAARRTILKYGVGDVIEHIITYPFENIYHFFPGLCWAYSLFKMVFGNG